MAEESGPPEVTAPSADGEIVAAATIGHFEIGPILGSGGMGVVFSARDIVLDRRVALKLLRPGNGDPRSERARARLLREAQVLARLKHPNIVTVFEVGTAGSEIFIAMELLEGQTLRDWIREPRDWREVVDVFLAIGRGLAAAHATGLVHRDVKPSNIFLDRDGTPKIGDFGLVAWAGAAADDSSDPARSQVFDETLTASGLIGTPDYMAPEQVGGARTDARVDQYAYCVSLHQALTGGLPGDGAGRPVPKALQPILSRGLAKLPGARYATMALLMADLARARRGRAPLWIALAAVAGGAAAVAGVWAIARHRADPCPDSAAIDVAWGPARAAAVRDHLVAVDPAQGAARAGALAVRLDPYAADWRTMRLAACRATRVEGAQSDRMLDLRNGCLDRRLAELEGGVGLLAAATTVIDLDRAVVGLTRLTPLDGCADTAALASAEPPPEEPAARARADSIAREVSRIATRERAGQFDGLAAQIAAAVEAARALGHPPTLAAALAERARVELGLYDLAGAGVTLRELTQVAAQAHDERGEAFAWTRLVTMVGFDESKPDAALLIAPSASAAVLRAGDPADLRAALLDAEGGVLDEGPRPAEGLAKLEQARVLLERAGAADPRSPMAEFYADTLRELAVAEERTGETAKGLATFPRAIAAYQKLYGPDSPAEALAWHSYAEELRFADQAEAAIAAARTAVRIREARIGDSPNLAYSLVSLGAALGAANRWDEALVAYDRALAIDRAQLKPDDPQMTNVMIGRGTALRHAGRFDEALALYRETIALFERIGGKNANLPITYYNRADLLHSLGRCPEALADAARAVSGFEAVRGVDSPLLAYPLVSLAQCQIELHRPADAVAPLERAAKLGASGHQGALVRFYHGCVAARIGHPEGRAEAQAARAELASDPPEMLVQYDRCLAR